MPSYDFTIQDHRIQVDYDIQAMAYVCLCRCGWDSGYALSAHIAQSWGYEHVAEREDAAQAAREKTRYMIHEEP